MASREQDLATFQTATGLDIGEALQSLEEHSWNLESALAAHQGHRPTPMQTEASGETGPPAAAAQQQNGWVSWIGSAVFGRGWWGQAASSPRRGTEDPAAARFLAKFERDYSDTHPTPLLTTFNDAVLRAKSDFKFLLVYLHSDLHENTADFCRETLATESMRDFVDDNFLFWMGCTKDSEGFRVSNTLQASTYPFLACVCTIGSTMTIVDAHQVRKAPPPPDLRQGPFGREKMCEWLMAVLEQHGPELISDKADAESRIADRNIREEQDLAFQMSLEEDRRKAQEAEDKLRREEDERREQAEAEERRTREATDREERKRQRRETAKQSLSPEPPVGAALTQCVAFRMPNGERLQRRFCAGDTVQAMYDFVDAHGGLDESYILATHFPKKEFTDREATLSDCQLDAQAMLFVDLTESDDEQQDE